MPPTHLHDVPLLLCSCAFHPPTRCHTPAAFFTHRHTAALLLLGCAPRPQTLLLP